MYGVKITVESVKGTCVAGLKKGDSWIINMEEGALKMGDFTGCCPELLGPILPDCFVMAFEGKLPWEVNGKAKSCCPDPKNVVEVSIERIPEIKK